jgi:hypothetical protein
MLVNGEKLHINDKDNDLKRRVNININDVPRRSKLCSDKEAESGAERYINILDAPECREFFLKVMYHLPYETREKILEYSVKKWIKSPKKYFTYCAKRELSALGF